MEELGILEQKGKVHGFRVVHLLPYLQDPLREGLGLGAAGPGALLGQHAGRARQSQGWHHHGVTAAFIRHNKVLFRSVSGAASGHRDTLTSGPNGTSRRRRRLLQS